MKSVFIAIPTYDGRIHAECHMAVMANVNTMRNRGISSQTHVQTGGCYIDHVRNLCVREFLKSKCDYLFFIDSDLAFSADAMARVVERDREIVFGAYPFKKGDLSYPVSIHTDDLGYPAVDRATGLIRTGGAPTGFMCVRRDVFERFARYYESRECLQQDNTLLYVYFDTGMRVKNDPKWYGEDYLFCKECVNMGVEIWCEPNINFAHFGFRGTEGNYHEYLKSQPRE